jgi:hypothetical protein
MQQASGGGSSGGGGGNPKTTFTIQMTIKMLASVMA